MKYGTNPDTTGGKVNESHSNVRETVLLTYDHDPKMAAAANKPFRCRDCAFTAALWPGVAAHRREVHA